MRYWLEKPTMQDVASLAPRVAEAEAREIWALSGRTPEEALHKAVEYAHSGKVYSVHCIDGLLGMGGVVPFGQGAFPWFLGQDLKKHRRWLVRDSRKIVQGLLRDYPLLMNVVGVWNRQSIGWLRYAGFTVEREALPIGRNGEEFYKFWITRR